MLAGHPCDCPLHLPSPPISQCLSSLQRACFTFTLFACFCTAPRYTCQCTRRRTDKTEIRYRAPSLGFYLHTLHTNTTSWAGQAPSTPTSPGIVPKCRSEPEGPPPPSLRVFPGPITSLTGGRPFGKISDLGTVGYRMWRRIWCSMTVLVSIRVRRGIAHHPFRLRPHAARRPTLGRPHRFYHIYSKTFLSATTVGCCNNKTI
jgi:hypothetical protein